MPCARARSGIGNGRHLGLATAPTHAASPSAGQPASRSRWNQTVRYGADDGNAVQNIRRLPSAVCRLAARCRPEVPLASAARRRLCCACQRPSRAGRTRTHAAHGDLRGKRRDALPVRPAACLRGRAAGVRSRTGPAGQPGVAKRDSH